MCNIMSDSVGVVANQSGQCRFLLPALQIQTVLDQATIAKRHTALSTMPTTLETAFESTISRIKNQKSQNLTLALEVLKWTFLAKRSLTIRELCHALSVEIDPSTMQPGNHHWCTIRLWTGQLSFREITDRLVSRPGHNR
jgi:hypothetical protein